MKTFTRVFRRFKKPIVALFNGLIKVLGWITLGGIILALTDIPYFAYYRLGTVNAGINKKPDYIIMLGSMGIPSPDDLMRIYYTADAWRQTPDAKIIIAFPSDTALQENSPELLMARELKKNSVDTTKIYFERYGYSTRTQALKIKNMLGAEDAGKLTVRIITSPEHMFRAIRTFRKAGFSQAGGTPTFEKVVREERLMKGSNKKAEKTGLTFRYRIWSYMIYEITVTREFCAIAYYKIRGWI
jgi:uncharacterized SAM-binding protein YcdF (DUF218 family)